jgi:hypothetical protein
MRPFPPGSIPINIADRPLHAHFLAAEDLERQVRNLSFAIIPIFFLLLVCHFRFNSTQFWNSQKERLARLARLGELEVESLQAQIKLSRATIALADIDEQIRLIELALSSLEKDGTIPLCDS